MSMASETGRPRRSTAMQRAEVRQRAAAGESGRSIAQAGFSDGRPRRPAVPSLRDRGGPGPGGRSRAAGESVRSIAEAVFGDVSRRGRVERILAEQEGHASAARPGELDVSAFAALPSLEQVRLLYARRLRELWLRDGGPPARELSALL